MKRSLIGDDQGGTAVEFALTAPLFIMLVGGVAGFGLLMWAQIGLQHAVEMAARCGSINRDLCGTTAAIQNYAVTQAAALYPPPSVFEVSMPACGVQVRAQYQVTFVAETLGLAPFTLSAQHCFPK